MRLRDHPLMRTPARNKGFTLIELLITVVVIGVLALVALPTYKNQVMKGRRSDAFDAMVRVQQEQERYRSQNASYAADLDTLGVSATSTSGHYVLSLANVTATGFELTAQPKAGGRQVDDASCKSMKLTVFKGTNVRTATNAANGDSTSDCWPS